jgi:hypothetical protein
MHLSQAIVLLLLGLALSACGPSVHNKPEQPDWMLGVFSTPGPGDRTVGLNAIAHYAFGDDGVLAVGGVYDCATNTEQEEQELPWVLESDDVVRIDDPQPGLDVAAWRVSRADTCEYVTVERVLSDGLVTDFGTWYRGAVCLEKLPPCPIGTECDGCESVWCDGAPPDCEE